MLNAALLLCLAAGPVDEADEAFHAGRYQDVLPLLDKALADPALSVAEQVRAHALAALIHSAFDKPTEAIAAYERALKADPTFDVRDTVSPKNRALFDEAKKNQQRKAIAPPPDWVQPPPAPAPPETPWFKNPWLWGTTGAVVVGAAITATVLVLQAQMPTGNVPNGKLE